MTEQASRKPAVDVPPKVGPPRAGSSNAEPSVPAPRGALSARMDAVRAGEHDLLDRGRYLDGRRECGDRDRAGFVARRRISPLWRRRYSAVLVAGDLIASAAAARVGLALGGLGSGWGGTLLALGWGVAFVVVLALGRAYEHRFVGGGGEEYRRVVASGLVLLAATSMATQAIQVDLRGLVLVGAPLGLLTAWTWHVAARQGLFALRRRGRCSSRVVVIGLERSVDELLARLSRERHGGLEVVAACVSRAGGDRIGGIPVAGTPQEATSVARRHYADTILLTAWSDVSEEELRRLSWDIEGSGYHLLVAPRLIEVSAPRMHLQTVAGVPLLAVDEPEFTGLRRVAKKLLDLTLATPGTAPARTDDDRHRPGRAG